MYFLSKKTLPLHWRDFYQAIFQIGFLKILRKKKKKTSFRTKKLSSNCDKYRRLSEESGKIFPRCFFFVVLQDYLQSY